MAVIEEFYPQRDEASRAAAEHIATRLSAELANRAHAAIVVSGGSTPGPALRQLAASDVAWARVAVLLSDERYLPTSDTDSNERMLRKAFAAAEAADIVSVYRDNETPDEACLRLQEARDALPVPFACALLGMGEDGHFASLFPDYPDLDSALDPHRPPAFIAVTTAASPHPRISMNLPALLESREILLLIFGERKKRVFRRALKPHSRLPVARLLTQSRTPVRVIWAP